MDQYHYTTEEQSPKLSERNSQSTHDQDWQRLYDALTPEQRRSLIAAFLPNQKQEDNRIKRQYKKDEPPQVVTWTYSTKPEPLPKNFPAQLYKTPNKKQKSEK